MDDALCPLLVLLQLLEREKGKPFHVLEILYIAYQ